MKKKTALLWAVLCIAALFTGCSSQKDFNITGVGRMELTSGANGAMVEITDKESMNYITETINAIRFGKDKSGKDCSGWSYSLKWYNSENKLIDEIVIMGENEIVYKNNFYRSMNVDDDMDISYLDMLLSGGETVCVAIVEEIENETMIVRPIEGSAERCSSDKFVVSTKYFLCHESQAGDTDAMGAYGASREPQAGDTIEITYFGGILETYPASFANVSCIRFALD